MSVLVDQAMTGYEPDREYKAPAIFEVLGAVSEMLVSACYVLGIPVRSVTEVRGWAVSADPIVDVKAYGLWHAFGL